MIHWRRSRLIRSIAAMSLAASLLASTAAAAGIAHTSYIGNNMESSIAVATAKPLWSSALDAPKDDDYRISQGLIAAGDGRIYAPQNGTLVALSVQTGKKLWSFGKGKSMVSPYSAGGVVYMGSADGTIYAVNAKTGKPLWASKAKSKNIRRMVIVGDRLIVENSDLISLNLKDGSLQWTDNYNGYVFDELYVAGDKIVTVTEESGAYTHNVMLAFDLKSGKVSWQASDVYNPVEVTGNVIRSQRTPTLFEPNLLPTIDTFDVKTGRSIKTVTYNPTNVNLEAGPGAIRDVWISGDHVYLSGGGTVYRYPKDADPATTKAEKFTITGHGDGMTFAAGPYENRLIFTDGQSIDCVKLINGSTVGASFGGLTNPIARFDLIHRGIYAAQTDGMFNVIDLITGKPVVRVQTGGRVFGPTQVMDGIVIVQSKGKLIAFKEPASLK